MVTRRLCGDEMFMVMSPMNIGPMNIFSALSSEMGINQRKIHEAVMIVVHEQQSYCNLSNHNKTQLFM